MFIQEMRDRGYLNQCTNLGKLEETCNKNQLLVTLGLIVQLAVYT